MLKINLERGRKKRGAFGFKTLEQIAVEMILCKRGAVAVLCGDWPLGGALSHAQESGGGVMLIDVQGLGALSQLLALVIASIFLLPVRRSTAREREHVSLLSPPTSAPNRPGKRSKNCEAAMTTAAAAAAAAAVLLEL